MGEIIRMYCVNLVLRFVLWRVNRPGAPEPYVIRDTETGEPYLRRHTLMRLFGRKVMLHIILRPDADRDLHDHPWNFLTFVLGGGYFEETNEPGHSLRWNPTGTIRLNRAGFAHRIAELPNQYALTLVLRGKRWRDWGFLTRCGWQQWQTYIAKQRRGVPICED